MPLETTTTCVACRQEFDRGALFCPNCGTAKARDIAGDPLISARIGERFNIVERLGHGASGTVYRAQHVTLPRSVAVKVLHHELCGDQFAMERFRREATTVGNIDNDHIVEIYDFGTTEDHRLYLIMELLQGETLDKVLERTPQLAISLVVDILQQLGEALMDAHALGYIHRDLRPHNIFLARRRGKPNFVKLLDFGLSKLVEAHGEAASTSLGMTFGEPRYMSPEQARGEPVDRRADIYSLGCIAYEMVAGEPPFQSERVFDILTDQVNAIPIEPKVHRPIVPAWLNRAIMKMLAKSPEERFATVLRLVEALSEQHTPNQKDLEQVSRSEPPSSNKEQTIAAATPSSSAPPHAKTANASFANSFRKTNPYADTSTPSGKNTSGTTSSAGISAAWFADGDLRSEGGQDDQLDDVYRARLQAARPTLAGSSSVDIASQSSTFYQTRRRPEFIIAWIIGVFAALLLLGTFLWPSKDTDREQAKGPPPTPTPQISPIEQDSGAKHSQTKSPHTAEKPSAPIGQDLRAKRSQTKSPRTAEKPSANANNKAKRIGSEARLRTRTSRPSEPPPVRPIRLTPPLPQKPPVTSTPPKNSQLPPQPDDIAKADFYTKLGQTALRNNQISTAAAHFAKARKLNPSSRTVQIGLGEIAVRQRSYAAAIRHLEPIAKSSRSSKIQTLLGQAYLGNGQTTRALASFKKALQLNPDNAQARNGYNRATQLIQPLE